MRKSMTATPPVGMREAVQAIGGICSRAQVYGRCGMRPPHYIVTLEGLTRCDALLANVTCGAVTYALGRGSGYEFVDVRKIAPGVR